MEQLRLEELKPKLLLGHLPGYNLSMFGFHWRYKVDSLKRASFLSRGIIIMLGYHNNIIIINYRANYPPPHYHQICLAFTGDITTEDIR